MAYGLPYGMASRDVALCIFITALIRASLGKTRMYREGKYLREKKKREEKRERKYRSKVTRGEFREFLIRMKRQNSPSFPPPSVRSPRWYRGVTCAIAFLCSSFSKNQIESSRRHGIGSPASSRELEKNSRLKRNGKRKVAHKRKSGTFPPASRERNARALLNY
jgi:hypothetical protein